ncbi:MAG: hypothetical protein LBH81_02435, partial [Rickettsiales bacterium]|nr:hypothetical protein [Rickettsiales bacterium]
APAPSNPPPQQNAPTPAETQINISGYGSVNCRDFVQKICGGTITTNTTNLVCYADKTPLPKGTWYANPDSGVFIYLGASNICREWGANNSCDLARKINSNDENFPLGYCTGPRSSQTTQQISQKDKDELDEYNRKVENIKNNSQLAAKYQNIMSELANTNDSLFTLQNDIERLVPESSRASILDSDKISALKNDLMAAIQDDKPESAKQTLTSLQKAVKDAKNNFAAFKSKFDSEQEALKNARSDFLALFKTLDKMEIPEDMKSDYTDMARISSDVAQNVSHLTVAQLADKSGQIRKMLDRIEAEKTKTEAQIKAEKQRRDNLLRARNAAKNEDPLSPATAGAMLQNFRDFQSDFTLDERNKIRDYLFDKSARNQIISSSRFAQLSQRIESAGGRIDIGIGRASIVGTGLSAEEEIAWLEYFAFEQFDKNQFKPLAVNSSEDDNDAPALKSLGAHKLTDASRWVGADGTYSAKRYIVDSAVGVALGAVGGFVVNSLMKSAQSDTGFENVQCTVGGTRVSGWRDQFSLAPNR